MEADNTFGGYLWKKGGDGWKRFFFSLSDTALLYYSKKTDAGSLVGFLDRKLILSAGSIIQEEMHEGRAFFVWSIKIENDCVWTLAASKAQKRTQFLAALEADNSGSFTPTSFRKARPKKSIPTTGRALFDHSRVANTTRDPLTFIANSLGCYESEYDQTIGLTDSMRVRNLELSLDELLGFGDTELSLLSIKESTMEKLEREIEELLKNDVDGETEKLIRSTLKRTICRHFRNNNFGATLGASQLRKQVVDTLQRRPSGSSKMSAWNIFPLQETDSQRILDATVASEDEEEESSGE